MIEPMSRPPDAAAARQAHAKPCSEVKRLSDELGPAAIAKRLGIARGSVYRVLEGDRDAGGARLGDRATPASYQ